MGLKMLTRSFRLNTSLISRFLATATPKEDANIGHVASDEGAGKHLKITARHTRLPVVAKAVVTDMGMESSTVRSVTLRVENPNFTFKAGQWIDMFIPGMETVGGFSMYSCPTHLAETGTLQLGIKFSRWPPAFWVHDQCKVGSEVKIRAGGDFYSRPESATSPTTSSVGGA
ncbi:oxidoreductase NAD-binding domain-containing protein 1-like [Homarus americanus]|uniref:oxidoreductase NAD-binding domain-containing protein 1-like n=1 Tax=Homarus americanus TaxID=6706 RepID=UPI001C47B7C4|nr:oxidoreductase NAD-binding domain-containing protein 1-like [Homarus americanus]